MPTSYGSPPELVKPELRDALPFAMSCQSLPNGSDGTSTLR